MKQSIVEVKVLAQREVHVCTYYTVSQKNDNDVAECNFNAHQPIMVIFGRRVAQRVCYQIFYVIKFVIPPFLTNVSALPGET